MMNQRAISVSQLNNYIKQVFDAEELLHNIEVTGEIDGLSIRGTTAYFSLKDKEAVISCVCYYSQKMREIKNGAQVYVRGSVTYWNKAGKISFTVHSCETFGFGQLFLKFEELKKRLEAEGYFSVKKPLPDKIKRIGVVTSRTGAVFHDIIKVAHRRNSNIDIVLYQSAVQGSSADKQICDGINYFAASGTVDVVIIARGGGSKEDLAAFNSECVAIAVSKCTVPTVSAVGHETDWSLIDLVADLRAATPSMAAEMVVREIISERAAAVRIYRHLCLAMKSKIERHISKINAAWTGIKSSINLKLNAHESRLRELTASIEANNPLAVLQRGYAKVYKGSAQVTDIGDVEVDDKLDIKLYNGTIGVQVWTKKSQN